MHSHGGNAHDGAELIGLAWWLVRNRGFDPADFVIAGSARLWIEGYADKLSDLDLVARGSTWERAWDMALRGEAVFAEGSVDQAKVIHVFGGLVEIGDHWILPTIGPDELIDEADVIGGLRYFPLHTVVQYKRSLSRDKDQADLEAIRLGHKGSDYAESAPSARSVLSGQATPVFGALRGIRSSRCSRPRRNGLRHEVEAVIGTLRAGENARLDPYLSLTRSVIILIGRRFRGSGSPRRWLVGLGGSRWWWGLGWRSMRRIAGGFRAGRGRGGRVS